MRVATPPGYMRLALWARRASAIFQVAGVPVFAAVHLPAVNSFWTPGRVLILIVLTLPVGVGLALVTLSHSTQREQGSPQSLWLLAIGLLGVGVLLAATFGWIMMVWGLGTLLAAIAATAGEAGLRPHDRILRGVLALAYLAAVIPAITVLLPLPLWLTLTAAGVLVSLLMVAGTRMFTIGRRRPLRPHG